VPRERIPAFRPALELETVQPATYFIFSDLPLSPHDAGTSGHWWFAAAQAANPRLSVNALSVVDRLALSTMKEAFASPGRQINFLLTGTGGGQTDACSSSAIGLTTGYDGRRAG